MGNALFYTGFIFSVVLHLIIFQGFLAFDVKIPTKKASQIEVTYQTIQPKTIKQPQQELRKEFHVVKEEKPLNKIKVYAKKGHHTFSPKGNEIKDMSKLKRKFKLDKKQAPKIKTSRTLDKDHNGYIPSLATEKITNVKHLIYYNNIRQRIKQKTHLNVDNNVNEFDFIPGKVYLSCVLDAQGKLKHVRIQEEKTVANDDIRGLVLRSVMESSPFPPFPHDFNYPLFTFNVEISVAK